MEYILADRLTQGLETNEVFPYFSVISPPPRSSMCLLPSLLIGLYPFFSHIITPHLPSGHGPKCPFQIPGKSTEGSPLPQ